MVKNKEKQKYNGLISDIGSLLEQSKKRAYSQINQILVQTYWEIGRRIVEFEQGGEIRAKLGIRLLDKLSKDLKLQYGKGFSKSNLRYMRQFYMINQVHQTVSGELSWSHYVELIKIENDRERAFYEKQCIKENWSVRELRRQKQTLLFERSTLGKVQFIKNPKKPKDIVKDPYVLEFLNIPEIHSEKELEQNIIDNLQKFLLELGKGFTFVARQFRMTLGNKHYYVDLVFYHRILKCFVLIDLKIGEVTHSDIGQMNMYLNYFKKEEMNNDNEPIGIILTKEKDKILVEYALGGLSNTLFVSKYQLYLPKKEELKRLLENGKL